LLLTVSQPIPWSPAEVFAALEGLGRADLRDVVWLDSAVGHPDLGRESWLVLDMQVAARIDAHTARFYGPEQGRELQFQSSGAVWAALQIHFARYVRHAGVDAPGWVGYTTYEAASLADPAIHPRSGDAPPWLVEFAHIRAAIHARSDCYRLVVTADALRVHSVASRWMRMISDAITAADRSEVRPFSAPLPALNPIERPDMQHTCQTHIATIIEEIHAGRIFQACYTYPFRFQRPRSLAPWYWKLRDSSPGDFAVYLRMGQVELASISPERFCQVENGIVSARPMKGTRPRRRGHEAEDAAELKASLKDRAENVMIVDLLRNDLGRVCKPGTVTVPELFAVETYETVLTMTSTIQGELRDGIAPFGLLRALFPPGSMTGAPKVEACNLLSEHEDGPRGLYSGSVARIGYDGSAAFSVIIRSLQAWGNQASWWVGGGIVADSVPEEEWKEACTKAAALFRIMPET
jgi:anthranilate/para-aminobenzoate synthase component I